MLPATSIAAALLPQVVPPDDTETVAVDLGVLGHYSLPMRPPSRGRLFVGWYVGTHRSLPARPTTWPLLASGHTTYGQVNSSQLTITATRVGRQLLAHSRSLRLTAVAIFTPSRRPRVVILRPFTLS